MQYLEPLTNKIKSWTKDYGVIAKNLAKISLKTLVPGAGEILADGVDYLFEIVEHKEERDWKNQVDQNLALIQSDQEKYLHLLETIEKHIGSLLPTISQEFHQALQQNPSTHQISQETLLKSLFDQAMQKQSDQWIECEKELYRISTQFATVQKKVDEICKTQIEIAIELKEGRQSVNDGLYALKQLYMHLSLQIQEQQLERTKNKEFRDFLVEIEHEMLNHQLNQARVILENAFIKKIIDLSFKMLYECKINALQGHLTQIEDLLEKSNALANINGIAQLKQQVKNASKWITHQEEYRKFIHQSGELIGDKGWTLDFPIGIGGMGEVWKARNLKGEIGAIKFVHQDLLKEHVAYKKFFDEIDSLSKLKHPNIIELKDWGVENTTQQLYLVMAYVEGETLRQVINRKHYLNWQEAKALFRDLVEALCLCHQANVIHKDIKPDNIIWRKQPKNQLVLIDFGIAKVKKISNATQTKTGVIMGTDLYMSQEHKSGGNLDGKTDVYSLGVTLLEVMSGKCAIDGNLGYVDGEALDLIDDFLMVGWRRRYDSIQLFEKLGGDLKRLKGVDQKSDDLEKKIGKLELELGQIRMAYENLESGMKGKDEALQRLEHLVREKENLIEKQGMLIKERDLLISEREMMVAERELRIKELEAELKKLKTQSVVVAENKNVVAESKGNQGQGGVVGGDRKVKGVGFKMVACPSGEFWMGTDDSSLTEDYWNRSKPRHKIKMSKGFWMGETQVTQELWETVMGWNPSGFKGSKQLPVEYMTWYDCLVFCNKLSEIEGFKACFTLSEIEKDGNHIKKAKVEWNRQANGYRLPTEAEWEYSAKAGTELIYSGSNSLDEVAWHNGNSGFKTQEVKKKKGNAWGIYDMTGNVWEWCMDEFNSEIYKQRNNQIENPILWRNDPCARVARGGSYWHSAGRCRVALRYWIDAAGRLDYRGFRLLRCEP